MNYKKYSFTFCAKNETKKKQYFLNLINALMKDISFFSN